MARKEWHFPDDLWLQLWEPEESRFFYYNVATGDSSWVEPGSYVPFVDPDEVKEEEAIKNVALASLAAQMRAQPVRTALGQMGYLGQEEDEEDEELEAEGAQSNGRGGQGQGKGQAEELM